MLQKYLNYFQARSHRNFYLKPKQWCSFDEKETLVCDLSHQHLSNIYWFHNIVCGYNLIWVVNELQDKYSGILLSYKPDVRSKQELDFLQSNCLIEWQESKEGVRVGNIIINQEIIGSYEI